MNQLPVYQLRMSPTGEGIQYVSLVDAPAMGVDWMVFNENGSPSQFRLQSRSRQIISGPLLIPDKPIYRMADAHREAHYVIFDKKTVYELCLRFFEIGNTAKVNLLHQFPVQEVFMFESFIIDHRRGMATPNMPEFAALPEGTWFGSYKINNKQLWKEFIETGIFRGFSIEGLFQYEKPIDPATIILNQIAEILIKP